MLNCSHEGPIGVLGGMGPLASAAFVKTIYSMYRGRKEQDGPIVLLYSNPKVGDRTSVFLNGGDYKPMLNELQKGICSLLSLGAGRVVVCCITAHYLAPKLPLEVQQRMISLLDVAIQEIDACVNPCLLACTSGTRRLALFEKHPVWPRIQSKVCLPTDSEQDALHEAIYTVKRNHRVNGLTATLSTVARAHGARAVVAGCTELHLLSQAFAGPNRFNREFEIIDPLAAIARNLMEETCATTVCA